MPEHQTAAPWLLPYPDPTGKAKLGATDFKELAERLTTLFKERFLTVTEHGASFAAASGELVKCTGAITVTLPAAAANAIVGVLANNHEVNIGAGASLIYGDFITGSTPITLLGYQHVVLQSDGTNWFIVAGEPKREQTYTEKTYSKVEAEAGVSPSATRPSVVNLLAVGKVSEALVARFNAGASIVGFAQSPAVAGATPGGQVTVYLNPGEKWSAEQVAGTLEHVTAYTKIL